MPKFVEGEYYWLEHEDDGWIPVKLKRQEGDNIVGVYTDIKDTKEQYSFPAAKEMPSVFESSLKPVENMVAMEELSEAAILHNLRMRFDEDIIYTYISSILVSMNPFKMIPIYSPAHMQEYRNNLNEGKDMPPHCYALAHNVYTALTTEGNNQSVIISGESGAGKTEATKLVLQYMAEMSGQGSEVEQQLLESNPVVEAFGNAKTVRNNNSSRFGKWIAISFDEKYHIHGAQITNYLLEKSRIVEPGKGERNYHAFYQLCKCGREDWIKDWKLDDPRNFKITAIGETIEVPNMDDFKEFEECVHAMGVLNFDDNEIEDIWRSTAAVMHLGNLEVSENAKAEADISTKDICETAAKLLGISPETLSAVLVSQKKKMGREFVMTKLNKAKAEANIHALAKTLYARMFDWLIVRVNKTLCKPIEKFHLVGVLDIFGFEIFEDNRFEQFCINFANEKMQQHFNHHIFAMEQEEYKKDDIAVEHVDFVDNQACLNLIEGKGGVLAMTDDELKTAGGSDKNLLEKLHTAHTKTKKNEYYSFPKKMRTEAFTIKHYAGEVTYMIGGFKEKNTDTLGDDAADAIRNSDVPFITVLAPVPTKRPKSVGFQFKSQLKQLMETLMATEPHFIRCIKSNNAKVKDTFDGGMVLRQLRYLGLKEVVNIRQRGYPIRKLHENFYKRYGILSASKSSGSGDDCKSLLAELKIDEKNWRIGKTKVFCRNIVQKTLEDLRQKKLGAMVIELQALARAKVARSRYLKVAQAAEELKKATETASEPDDLDDFIETYENLNMNIQPAILQKAVELRNLMYKRKAAVGGLKAALKAKDAEMLANALAQAEKCTASESGAGAAALVADVTKMIQDIKDLRVAQDKAFHDRELSAVDNAIKLADALGFDDYVEKQAKALREKLAEEDRVKDALQEAMKAKDIETLKKTLQVALSHKSGAMVGSALERALSLGLADDPLVKEAIEKVDTLEKEIQVHEMGNALEKAIETRDRAILQMTVDQAKAASLDELPQVADAVKLIAQIDKENDLIDKLNEAVKKAQLGPLNDAIKAAEDEGLSGNPSVASAKDKVKEIERVLRELEEARLEAERQEQERLRKEAEEARMREMKEKAAQAAAIAAREKAAAQAAAAAAELRAAEEAAAEAAREAQEAAEEAARLEEEEEKRAAEAAAEEARKAQEEARLAQEAARKHAAEAAEKAAKEAAEAEAAEQKRLAEVAAAEKIRKEAEAKEAEQRKKAMDDKVAQAAAYGLEDNEAIKSAKADQDKKEKILLTTNAIESAIEDRNMEQLASSTQRAKDLGVPTTNETLKNGLKLLAELREEQDIRDRDLKHAQAAQEQEDFAEPPPPPEVEEVIEAPPDGEKIIFDPETYKQDTYRFTLFTGFRDSNDYAVAKYFKMNKKALKKGMFRHAKDLIPKSLLTSSSHLNKEAINCFKSIQGWMRDRSISFPESGIQELISLVTDHKELRNEVYCQVMKQLTQNPKKDSEKQGWMIMALLAEHVPPSDSLLNYVLNFVYEHIEGPYETDISDYAQYTLNVLQNTVNKFRDVEYVPKRPDIAHITYFRDRTMKSAEVIITFPDGSETEVTVDPWETNEELIPRVAAKVGIKETGGLKIFEMKAGAMQVIPMEECVLDNVMNWHKAAEEEETVAAGQKKKKGFFLPSKKQGGDTLAVDTNRLIMTLGFLKMPVTMPTCEVMQRLVAAQHMRDIVDGKQKLANNEAVELAAKHTVLMKKWKIIAEIPKERTNGKGEVIKDVWISRKLSDCPVNKLAAFKKQNFPALVAKEVPKFEKIDVATYLEDVSQRLLFGAQYFRVMNLAGIADYPPLVEIAINHRGLMVMSTAADREVKSHWQLLHVMGWSHTPVKIKLKVKLTRKIGGKSADTLNFTTSHSPNMSKHMCELLLAYATEMINAINAQKAAKKKSEKKK